MVVGLTGGIGSGKTTIAKMFHELGVPIYVADNRAKYLMETSTEIHTKLISLLGPEALDKNGLPNRSFIASKVFKDKVLLEKLNAIVHPEVAKDFQTWVKLQKSAYVIYEAAIIFEKKLQDRFNFTILVTAPKDIKVKRIQGRDNATLEEIEARMNNQWSDSEKIKLANFSIENVDLDQTKLKVLSLHKILLGLVNT
ncbi:dephospho-CoA kinase [Mesonia phycicola]|uniref:Dephospho-CoA kinase n=2 Tax=Mesonia phycicola TaxID=579105 RepID=A0A1M6FJH7_9FLAO|nr:dephospho-CoA kinase [Mesonia phycicola]